MPYHYSTTPQKTHAKAVGRSLQISMKAAVVISHELRGQTLGKAKAMLSRVITMKQPLRYFRYNHNIGHRKGSIGPGRFPILASKAILSVLESAEANANTQGLTPKRLVITNILANKGSINWRNGRRRVRGKRTHVEVILQEQETTTPQTRKQFIKKKTTPTPPHTQETITHLKTGQSKETLTTITPPRGKEVIPTPEAHL